MSQFFLAENGLKYYLLSSHTLMHILENGSKIAVKETLGQF